MKEDTQRLHQRKCKNLSINGDERKEKKLSFSDRSKKTPTTSQSGIQMEKNVPTKRDRLARKEGRTTSRPILIKDLRQKIQDNDRKMTEVRGRLCGNSNTESRAIFQKPSAGGEESKIWSP